jgi:hypothetical protein
MFVNADDYRRRALKLEELAAQTPNECLRKALTSIAANWRGVADSLRDEPPSRANGPLIDGRPRGWSHARR